jgi:hypothetical protein
MVYNPDGMEVLTTEQDIYTGTETPVMKVITKADWDSMKPDIRIDTSQDSPWTKEAEQNLRDALLDKQHITFEEYVDLSTEHGIVPKNKLKKILEKRKVEQAQMAAMQPQEEEIDPEEYARQQWDAQEGLEEEEQ